MSAVDGFKDKSVIVTGAALPHMLVQGKGAIVNTASEARLRGSCAGTPNTTSKHGIIGLTKSDANMGRMAQASLLFN